MRLVAVVGQLSREVRAVWADRESVVMAELRLAVQQRLEL